MTVFRLCDECGTENVKSAHCWFCGHIQYQVNVVALHQAAPWSKTQTDETLTRFIDEEE